MHHLHRKWHALDQPRLPASLSDEAGEASLRLHKRAQAILSTDPDGCQRDVLLHELYIKFVSKDKTNKRVSPSVTKSFCNCFCHLLLCNCGHCLFYHLWKPTLRTVVLEGCITCHALWRGAISRLVSEWKDTTTVSLSMHPFSCSLRFSHDLVQSKELDVYCLCGVMFTFQNTSFYPSVA